MALPDGSYPLTASFSTAAWETRNSSAQSNEGSLELVWSGLNAANSTASIEGTNDGTHWNILAKNDGTANTVTLVASSGAQIWEIAGVRVKYIRLTYTAGANTAGTGVITTYFISRD